MAVGKPSMILLTLLLTVTVIVLLALFSYSSRFRGTSYPNLRPAVQGEDDIELPTHNFATARLSNVTMSTTTGHVIASPNSAPPTLCNDQCAPCSKRFFSCKEVTAAEPRMRPKLQHIKRKVVLSTDVMRINLAWFVPVTSLLWYEKMGWQPVLFVVYRSENEFTPLMNLIINYAVAAGVEVHKFKHTLNTSKYPMKVFIESIRLAGCVLDWPEDTYVLTSDLDMWPLNADFYNNETSYNTSVHLLFANAYGSPKVASEYPMCYIGMNLSTWREIMNCHEGQNIMNILAELRDFVGGNQWGIDQHGFTRRLKHWKGFPNSVHFTSRDTKVDRIDRSFHKDNYVWTSQKVEAHVLRPPFTAQNWPQLRTVLHHVLDQEEMEWIDQYAGHICNMLYCFAKDS